MLSETATLWETRVLRRSGTTLRSCAVNGIVPVPVTGLGTRSNDPFELNTSDTQCEELCKRSLLQCLWSHDRHEELL